MMVGDKERWINRENQILLCRYCYDLILWKCEDRKGCQY